MKKLLLDASVLIDFLRRKKKKQALLVRILAEGYSPLISLITHTELFSGKSVWQKEKAKKELEDLLSGLEIIVMNEQVSQLAGRLKAKHQINLVDAIVAAEAIVSRLPLATLNLKDFKKIKEIEIFKHP